MKTVTGKLVATKPISLSNAAKYLTRFTFSDNGPSPAVALYLQRATDSFNSLVQLHEKLKAQRRPHPQEPTSYQPLDSDAKIETLVSPEKTRKGKRKAESETKEKGKKKRRLVENN